MRRFSKAGAARIWVWVMALGVLALGGCARSLPDRGQSGWRPVDMPEPSPSEESPEERARRLLLERVRFEAKRSKVQAAFATDEERACTADEGCVLTPEHCCTCAAGGRQTAVHATQLPGLLGRRASVCRDVMCPQVLSRHPSCAATEAFCDEEGQCAPRLPAEPALPAAGVGLGVAPIPLPPTDAGP